MRRSRSHIAPRMGASLPLSLLVQFIVLMALLLAACGGPSASKSPTKTPAPPTPTATPARVASAKGDVPPIAGLPAGVASCEAVDAFHSAGASPNGGQGFADVLLPPHSVSVDAGSGVDNYAFRALRVCTDGATAADVLTFFAAKLPGAGWQPSATYPYHSDPTQTCGDPYCWRKAVVTDIRYASIENMSASGTVSAYTIRFATAPIATARFTVRSSSASTNVGGATLTVTAGCQGGEQLVSGGYQVNTSDHSYTPQASFPSGNNTWTTVVHATGGAAFSLDTYVGCLQANFTLGAKIVTSAFDVPANGSGESVAMCPAGSVVTNGGFQLTPSSGVPADSAATKGLTGWHVVVTTGATPVKATVYALCATRNAAAGATTSLPFSIYSDNDTQVSISCNGSDWLTAGGYSNNDPSGDGKNVFILNAPTADYSRWFLQGHNFDGASTHGVTLWAVCIAAAPRF